jgi:hypothetical protein
MGVKITNYLIHGIVLNKEQGAYVEKNWSKDDLPVIKYVEGRPETEGHILLVDFMSGEDPTIFGKVLGKSSEYDGGDYIKTIPIPELQDRVNLIEHYNRCFPNEIKFVNEFNLMMVTYYS